MTLTLQVMLSFLRHHLLQFRRSHVTLLCLAANADRCGSKNSSRAKTPRSSPATHRSKHSQSLWRKELMQATAVSFVEADIPSSDAAAAAAAAAAINSLRAHAAVHLDGHNGDSLIAAFALRPALLQVSGPVLSAHASSCSTSPHVTRWRRRTTDSSPPQPRRSSPCTSPTPSSPPSSAPVHSQQRQRRSSHNLQVRFCSIHGEIDSPSTLVPSQSSSGTHLILPALRPCARRQRRVLSRASQVALAAAAVAVIFFGYPHLCLRSSTLARHGIPSSSTVLAAFSRPAKLDIGTFKSWLTALKSASDAVLVMIDFNEEGVTGMRAAAAAAGVDASRVIAVPSMAEGVLQRDALGFDSVAVLHFRLRQANSLVCHAPWTPCWTLPRATATPP